MEEEILKYWNSYRKKPASKNKEQLIKYYLPLVRNVALGVFRKLPSSFELEDLVNDGVFGLIKAIERFDLNVGVKFETYAVSVIRGSILNGLRDLDWVPERTRVKARALQKAMDKFSSLYGRTGTKEELAKELHLSAEEIYDLINNLACIYMLSLDQPAVFLSNEETILIGDTIEDQSISDPSLDIEFKEQRDNLMKVINLLEEREQKIIKWHYFEGKTFEEIAKSLKVTKQRISQMHMRIIKKLRDLLE
ncbi:MAG: FliA/WhiG family RNA polymerase sigma factor [Armatimonadetes bacterium]|nr:FliA/WhiG family RNA polymerase sigma factor [Armatimonadota bacterium]